jgi:hypothetical protein
MSAKKIVVERLHLKSWDKKNKNCLHCSTPLKDALWTMDIFYYDFAPNNCQKYTAPTKRPRR